jgi:ABC-type Na+ efflux pump permease subunit
MASTMPSEAVPKIQLTDIDNKHTLVGDSPTSETGSNAPDDVQSEDEPRPTKAALNGATTPGKDEAAQAVATDDRPATSRRFSAAASHTRSDSTTVKASEPSSSSNKPGSDQATKSVGTNPTMDPLSQVCPEPAGWWWSRTYEGRTKATT